MPASCTLRLNLLSTNSNESPGRTKISVIRATSASGGCYCRGQSLATDNNHCNRQVGLLAAEMAPGPLCHNSHRWRYTSDGLSDLHSCCARDRYSHYLPTACAQRGTQGIGSVHWSVHGSRKILARQP